MKIEELEECEDGADDGVSGRQIVIVRSVDAKRAIVGAGARILFYPTLLYNVLRNKIESEFRWWDQVDQVDGQLPGNVQAISDVSEQVMNVFHPCEKSRGQLILEVSNEQRGSISHGPKSPASHGPKDSSSHGSPSTKASLDKDEKETIKAGMIFQAKAKEKGKQILSKGSLKKIARAKGRTNDEQTLAQLKVIGIKRLRGKETSEDEDTHAKKRRCETVPSDFADSVLEVAATAGQRLRDH